ncbi:unnamed protein product [Bursaphelenchus xylophilus]|uniref:(pine wood nematode) hypothetical protein n=1 Tax=Bursaphelenchus xylophilus TaxID=6326 RepID=A0A7I8XHY7_BURXY|nr:unnamed protein product [Bursaphelenchus xylophilus]CAG9079632.1 unnamed protein product [Bursaphelenchus xylophilus]
MSYITGEEKEEFIYDILYNLFVATEDLHLEYRCKVLEKRLRGRILDFYQALNKNTEYFGDIMDPLMEEFGYEKDFVIDYLSTFPHYDQILIRDSLPSQDEAYKAFQLQKHQPSDIKKLDLHCNFCGKPNHLEKSCFKKKRECVLSSKNLPESQEQCQSDLSQSDLNNSSPIVHDKHPDLTCSSDPKEIIDPTDAYDENFDELLRCYRQLMERYKRNTEVRKIVKIDNEKFAATNEPCQSKKPCESDSNIEEKGEDHSGFENGDFEELFYKPEAPLSHTKANYQTDYTSELSKSVFMSWNKEKYDDSIDFMEILDDSLYAEWLKDDPIRKKCSELDANLPKVESDCANLAESCVFQLMSSLTLGTFTLTLLSFHVNTCRASSIHIKPSQAISRQFEPGPTSSSQIKPVTISTEQRQLNVTSRTPSTYGRGVWSQPHLGSHLVPQR